MVGLLTDIAWQGEREGRRNTRWPKGDEGKEVREKGNTRGGEGERDQWLFPK